MKPLSSFPRRTYVTQPTPLQPAPRLSRLLGGPEIFIKRDDLLPGAGGGNKTRKLEFSIGDALAQGADTLITSGAIQSNHCRLTLSWARVEGLECHLVLQEPAPGAFDPEAGGNNFLYQLLGADSLRIVSGREEGPRRHGAVGRRVPGAGTEALPDSSRRVHSGRRHRLRRLRPGADLPVPGVGPAGGPPGGSQRKRRDPGGPPGRIPRRRSLARP